MKLRITVLTFLSALSISSTVFAQAEKVSTKFCEESAARIYSGLPALTIDERLASVVDGFNEGYFMGLTVEQKKKTISTLADVLKIDAKKIDHFESAAAMPCYLDMTKEERIEAGNDLKRQLGL